MTFKINRDGIFCRGVLDGKIPRNVVTNFVFPWGWLLAACRNWQTENRVVLRAKLSEVSLVFGREIRSLATNRAKTIYALTLRLIPPFVHRTRRMIRLILFRVFVRFRFCSKPVINAPKMCAPLRARTAAPRFFRLNHFGGGINLAD